jgi:hypothetical protein
MTTEVQFERHIARTAEAEADALSESITRKVNLARGGTFVVAAVLVAALTQVAGLGTGGALCVFFGLLPVMWLLSWLAGMRAIMRGVRQRATLETEGPTLRRETVKLRAAPSSLEVSYDGAVVQHWPWSEVSLDRSGGGLHLKRGAQGVDVPSAAFSDAAQLEAFAAFVEQYIEGGRA